MKNNLIRFGMIGALCVIVHIAPANAVVKCVLRPNNCQNDHNADGDNVWSRQCSSGGNSLVITGFSACAIDRGSVIEKLDVDTSGTRNNACYCKVFSPFESKWVYSTTAIGDLCAEECERECGYLSNWAEFFKNIIG